MTTDELFSEARAGDPDAFASWAERVHRSVRTSLRRFARAVDVEAAVQETLLRMWIVARDPARVIVGENASLRYALSIARLVALEEVRRSRRGQVVSLEGLDDPPDPAVEPEPRSDPALRRAILACLEALPARAGSALAARLREGHRAPDRDLASRLGMSLNAFLQNVVRARRLLAACLEGKGVMPRGASC